MLVVALVFVTVVAAAVVVVVVSGWWYSGHCCRGAIRLGLARVLQNTRTLGESEELKVVDGSTTVATHSQPSTLRYVTMRYELGDDDIDSCWRRTQIHGYDARHILVF